MDILIYILEAGMDFCIIIGVFKCRWEFHVERLVSLCRTVRPSRYTCFVQAWVVYRLRADHYRHICCAAG
jgi:hypothetical protein